MCCHSKNRRHNNHHIRALLPDRSHQHQLGRYTPEQRQSQTIPKINHWQEAIEQWEKDDPDNGLAIHFRDWDSDIRKDNHYSGYALRKDIFEQFELHGHSEDKMAYTFGKQAKSATMLFNESIGEKQRERLTS